ncbi:Gfo/Idh/MocA family protein [Planctomycetota bacterium]
MKKQQKSIKQAKLSRRELLGSAAAVAAFTIVPRHVLAGSGQQAPSDKLNIAGIGVGGQGSGDIGNVSSENIYALCDVDENRAGATFGEYPDAKQYKDYRIMLDKEQNNIDAVVIATPDHHHTPASIRAMKLSKHVYVEKPMAHTIFECREMLKVSREMKVVTQMGNQGHGGAGLRLWYNYIHSGAIGKVKEIYVWTDRPGGAGRLWWPQGVERPVEIETVPSTLEWDLWLGPAPYRLYHSSYVPFNWRGRWDWGTGSLGDMACHNMDPAFWCLDLGAPVAVEAQTSGINSDTYPASQNITYSFEAKGDRPAVDLVWYDGGNLPPVPEDLEGNELGSNGCMIIGENGTLMGDSHAAAPQLYPEARSQEVGTPPELMAPGIGHHAEWLQACKDNRPEDALAGFEYSAPFTEGMLVGNLAVRLGRRIEWDIEEMKAPNAPEADILINKEYRTGWEVVV